MREGTLDVIKREIEDRIRIVIDNFIGLPNNTETKRDITNTISMHIQEILPRYIDKHLDVRDYIQVTDDSECGAQLYLGVDWERLKERLLAL